jgi:hypothetical protein
MFGFWGESSRKLGMSSPPETELRGRQYVAPTLKILYPFFIFNYYCA